MNEMVNRQAEVNAKTPFCKAKRESLVIVVTSHGLDDEGPT